MSNVLSVEVWKKHVLECGICRNAQSTFDVCPTGRQFWELPPPMPPTPPSLPQQSTSVFTGSYPRTYSPAPQSHPAAPAPIIPIMAGMSRPAAQAPLQPQEVAQALSTPIPANMPDARFIASIARRVADKVVARSETGAAIAVPMEKTSKAVSIMSAPGVILNMPERDIEIYAEMKEAVRVLATLGEMIGKTIMVKEETRRASKDEAIELDEEQTALIVRQIGSQFGAYSEEDLHSHFSMVAGSVLRLGDRLGNFMRVDDETRKIIRAARKLGIEMQTQLERSYGGKLPLDDEMRSIVRQARMLAMDLQGEIERRIGTP